MKSYIKKLFSILLVFTCIMTFTFVGDATVKVKAAMSDNLYSIMGQSNVTLDQMINYYEKHATYPSFYKNTDAPTIYHFCKIYSEECEAEGVKKEVAFCQAMKETGYLKFGGDVKINQYNFAGIGATGGGNPGNSFRSVREGVRAQVQHLKAYASTERVKNPVVDPRYQYVYSDKVAKAPYVQWLGIHENPNHTGWAAASRYGYSLIDSYIADLYGVSKYSTWYNGVDYKDVYDPNYYMSRYADVAQACGGSSDTLIGHFVNYGMNEGRQGNSEFDVHSYKNEYADLRSAYGTDLKKYYMHYINYGKREGRHGLGCTSLSGVVISYNGKNYSAVYDYNYYVNNNPDVKAAFNGDDVKTLKHFVEYGMNEGRRGSENFDVVSYKNAYGDLRAAYGKDLKKYYMHYINYGKKEGRITTGVSTLQNPIRTYQGVDYSLVYDYNYYIQHNPDVARAFPNDDVATLKHFINYGMNEGRIAKDTFNVKAYKNAYRDLRAAYGNNMSAYYKHYIDYGYREGRVAV
ncbi:Mannosyl-glycoprotein endo-beta-N-acetylglucosaminidase [Lachnospiraceae bacterium C7]|nr:Mannosyl-glycoprotein endo-beta-N-acetylglucosaminidase [Lachnospiraceae bacterium C7]